MNTSLKQPVLTIAGASASALAIWIIAVPVAGHDLTVRMGGGTRDVGAVAVVLASLLAGLAAWGLLAVLRRRTARGNRVWAITAMVVLGVSLAGPTNSGAGTATALILMLLHFTVGVTLVLGLGLDRRR
ncbi:DUF6069 family protein [Actinomadura rupiterrae]|uniref:DUF6069 family protein n=1 Tax=Actinomadura rupiterrae TaxID=559627 RepID=UPI0020A56ABB|nr:DUF6069 family protein [Actinomadura rupiterrae]MCP2342844.1 hypothetical protein [Actinomadura rupiterrae]